VDLYDNSELNADEEVSALASTSATKVVTSPSQLGVILPSTVYFKNTQQLRPVGVSTTISVDNTSNLNLSISNTAGFRLSSNNLAGSQFEAIANTSTTPVQSVVFLFAQMHQSEHSSRTSFHDNRRDLGCFQPSVWQVVAA